MSAAVLCGLMVMMRSRRWLGCCSLAVMMGGLVSFTAIRQTPAERVKACYQKHLNALETALNAFRSAASTSAESTWKAHFTHCRKEYKSIEYAVEYYYPAIAVKMNGPALAETEPGEPAELILPTGLQVLEEEVYSEAPPERLHYIQKELDHLIYLTHVLQQQYTSLSISEPDIYDALKLNLYRLAAKGLSGFDSPVALHSLEEGAVTVAATEEVLDALDIHSATLKKIVYQSRTQLEQPGINFNHFDRARFFTSCFNPLMNALHHEQIAHKVPFLKALSAVRTDAVSFFAPNAFDVIFFAPPAAKKNTPALVQLGKMLFRESKLSGSGRSCAGCHSPAHFYTDGLKVNRSIQRDEQLLRNTPILLNAALQPTLFWDSRVKYLEEQAHEVITNKAEMDGSMERIISALGIQQQYRTAFAKAFPGMRDTISESNICAALAAYVRSLISLDAPFDRYMRGDANAMSAQQVAGFNLFMGKAKCGTCHYMPLFNGVAPPDYTRADGEVLGTPVNTDTLHPELDGDRGMYLLQRIRHQDYAFKTPTLRNIAHTAPYMHNGVYKTLGEVIDFYDRGGGAGMGLNVPTQTLSSDRLQLTTPEKAALIAFLKAL